MVDSTENDTDYSTNVKNVDLTSLRGGIQLRQPWQKPQLSRLLSQFAESGGNTQSDNTLNS